MNEHFTVFFNILGALAIAALAFFIFPYVRDKINRRRFSVKFYVGVLGTTDPLEIKPVSGLILKEPRKSLAKPISTDRELQNLQNDKSRCKEILINANRMADIPIIFQNASMKAIKKLFLGINLPPEIELINISTDGWETKEVFAAKPESFECKEFLVEKSTSSVHKFYADRKLLTNWIIVGGGFSSEDWALLSLTIKVTKNLPQESFIIFYITCYELFTKGIVFAQPIKLIEGDK